MAGNDMDLRSLRETLYPKACDRHRVLIRDQGDRDAIASSLLRCRDRATT